MNTSTFQFGFSGDDIDGVDGSDSQQRPPGTMEGLQQPVAAPPLGASGRISPQRHSLAELLRHLPEQISYGTLRIPGSNQGHDGNAGNVDGDTCIPRRELFDIRMQLMASDEAVNILGTENGANDEADTSLLLLGNDDIKTSVYEGGLKSWECSLDLVSLLAGNESYFHRDSREGSHFHVLELGCGTALPSAFLFQRVLAEGLRNVHFTLADYNIDVLQLVTIPNMLLSWLMICKGPPPPPLTNPSSSSTAPLHHWQDESDVEITRDLIEEFTTYLQDKHILIDAISGPWNEQFICLLPYNAGAEAGWESHRLILASETIYSPSSLDAFALVLSAALQPGADHASARFDSRASRQGAAQLEAKQQGQPRVRALVASKKLYFGVGGGVDDFISRLEREHGSHVTTVGEHGSEGVKRCILEICPG